MFNFLRKQNLFRRFFKKKPSGANAFAQEIFKKFLSVLNANNRALETITDIGEKLSGDYLFDRSYLETIVVKLNKDMIRAIDAINDLTQGRTRKLFDTFELFKNKVNGILNGKFQKGGPPLIWLSDIRPWHFHLVGGKGSNLGEMARDPGISVPQGFVITTCQFFEIIETNGLRPAFDRFNSALDKADFSEIELSRMSKHLEEGVLNARVPEKFLERLDYYLLQLEELTTKPLSLAIRSSTLEEDMGFSFAGQFLSLLDIPDNPEAVFRAYLKVTSSLFGKKSIEYRKQVFQEDGNLAMAVVCQKMINSKTSGVVYSLDPANPESDTMVIVGANGLGQTIVEGQTATDFFRLSRTTEMKITERIAADKTKLPSIADAVLFDIGQKAIHLENYFRGPQDIEWTIDQEGRLYILQARPLKISKRRQGSRPLAEELKKYRVLWKGAGHVAQLGIGAGKAYCADSASNIDDFPEGAVLVSRRDSSQFIEIMHRAAAIVTEIGSPVSHMATLCRELQVPCIVGLTGIMDMVSNGDEITVDAEECCIYLGRVSELLAYQASNPFDFGASREFQLLKRIQREVSRLYLIDPLIQNFSLEKCRSYHDILRYIHETAVLELVELGKEEKNPLSNPLSRSLELSIPAGILVIDIGSGMAPDAPRNKIQFSDIQSRPFRSIIKGMLTPGVWHSTSMQVGFRDLMSSILTVPTDMLSGQYAGRNIAIISDDYVNLCFRFGYHFNIIDAYCNEVDRNNHIYFRFLGGATDITKRSRRTALIASILKTFDFNFQTKGDLVIARIHNLVIPEMEKILEMLGRLVGFTRQLDVKLNDDDIINTYKEAFLAGDYGIIQRI